METKLKRGDFVCAYEPKSMHLTHKKGYHVQWIAIGGNIAVRNDEGKIKPYSIHNFDIK